MQDVNMERSSLLKAALAGIHKGNVFGKLI
jgi:hypothetical protein